MKILLAVDGSKFTKKMLAYLTTHPELFGPHNAFTAFTAIGALPPRARAAVGRMWPKAITRKKRPRSLRPW